MALYCIIFNTIIVLICLSQHVDHFSALFFVFVLNTRLSTLLVFIMGMFQEQLVVRAIFKKAASHKNGMRYEPEFILECMPLRMKSNLAYHHIRAINLLPLPSQSTMRRLLSCTPCSFGLNKFALDAIKKSLEGKEERLRYGSLVADEMAITAEANCNGQTLLTDGFVNFGDDVTRVSKRDGELADHALVLIFRPFRESWIQPIAVYTTKGACPGTILHEILSRAIIALDMNGAIVKSIVCDSATSNKVGHETLWCFWKIGFDSKQLSLTPYCGKFSK